MPIYLDEDFNYDLNSKPISPLIDLRLSPINMIDSGFESFDDRVD